MLKIVTQIKINAMLIVNILSCRIIYILFCSLLPLIGLLFLYFIEKLLYVKDNVKFNKNLFVVCLFVCL